MKAENCGKRWKQKRNKGQGGEVEEGTEEDEPTRKRGTGDGEEEVGRKAGDTWES